MSKLSKIASKGLRMFSWSQDALQESVKLKVGDEVEVIASPELLSLISIDDFEVAKGIVYYINPDPTDNWDYDNLNGKLKDYNGTIEIRFPVEIWHFPYSHWRDFLRKVPKTTLAWSQKALEEKPFEHYVGWFVEDNTPGCASSVKYCYITNVTVARNDMVSLWGYWASNYQDVMEEANKPSYASTFYTSLTPENVEKYIKKLHYVGPIKKSIQGSITKEAWSQDALNPQPQVGDKVRLTDDVDTLRSIGISCENCPSAPGIITYVDDDTIKIELGQIADERRFGFKMRVLIPPTNWEEFFTIVLKKEAWSQEALRDDIRVGDKVKIIGPDSLLESVSLNTSYASGAIGKVVSIFKNASYNFGVHRSYVGNITGHFLEHINGTPYQYHFPYSHWKEFLEIVDDTDKTTSLKLSWQEHLDPRSVWEGSQQMPDFFWENIPSSVRWYGDGELYYNELPDDIKSKFEAALLIWERKEKKRKRKAEEYERNFRNKRKLSWQQFRPLEAEALGFIEALERLNLDVDNTIFRKITAFLYYSYPDHSTFMHMLRLAGYEELAQEHLDLLTKIVKASRFFNHHYSDVVDAVNNHLQKLLNLKNTLNQRAVTWHVRNENLLYEGFPQSLLTETSLKFSKEETPSEAQLEAGNYKKKHIRKDGFDISIENDKGSTRSGTSKDGKEWSVKMKHAYGYIKGTEGKDGDHVDVIIADDYKEDQSVFIVNQTDDKGKFDEHKVCIGFLNKDDAEKAYLDNYEKGWKNYENIVEMPMEQFKQWVKDKKYTKNLAKPLKLSWKIPDLERYLKPGAVFRKQYYGSPNYQYFYIHELQRKIVNFFKTEFPENTTDDFNDSDMQQFYGIITDSGITDIIDRYNEHKFGVYAIFLSDNWMESMEYLGQIEDVVANANTVESKLAWKIHKTTYTRDEFLEVVGPYQVWTFTSDTGYMHIPFKTLDKAAFIGFDNIGRPKITDSYFKSYTDREYESGQMPFDYAVINKSWVEFELVSGTPKTSSLKFSWAIQPTEVYNLEEFLDTVKPNQIWEALGEDSGKKYFITSYKAKAEKFRLDNLSFLYMVSNAIWSDNINTVVNNRVGGIINIPLSKLPMRLIQDKSTIKQSWAIQPTIPDRIKWDDNVARQKMIGKDLVGVFNSASTFALGWNVNICKITNANWIKILEHIHLDIPSYSDALDTADEYALSHGLTRIVSPGEPGYNDIPKMAWQFPIEVGDIVETTKRITDGNADGWDLPAGKRGEVFDIESSEHKFPPYRYGIEFFMLRDRDTSRPEAWYLFDDEIKLVEKKISSLKLNTWKIVEPEIMTLAEYRSQFTDDSNRNEVWIVRNSDGDSWAVVLKEIPSERGAFFNKENLSFENAQRIGRELAVERDAIYIITDWEQVKITPSSSLKQSSTSSKGLRIVSWKVFNPEYLVGWDNVLNYWKQPDSNPIVISFMKRATGYITVTTWYPHMEGHRVSLGDDIFNEHAKKLQGLHMDYDDWKHIEKEFSLAKIKDALIYANELSAEYNNAPFYIIDGTSNIKGDDDIWAQEVLSVT